MEQGPVALHVLKAQAPRYKNCERSVFKAGESISNRTGDAAKRSPNDENGKCELNKGVITFSDFQEDFKTLVE